MGQLQRLKHIRSATQKRKTEGLPDAVVEHFLKSDKTLALAIDMAVSTYEQLKTEFPKLIGMDETEQIAELQAAYLNFYSEDTVNPYIAIAAQGPWIVTSTGAIIYDAGGYGMLGLGHAPEVILKAMNKPHVMANIMTPSFSQKRLAERLFREIGCRRSGAKRQPFQKFLCVNSGSEAMTVAARISDINVAKVTAPGQKHAGRKVKYLAFKGSFHGRTELPAQVSDSSLPKYREVLASFRTRDNLVTITPNDTAELKAAFAKAKAENVFFEAMFIEPVMGEGNPGQALSPDFYKAARELTASEGTILICDSIQASLRAHGCLSVVDYPGFEELDPPDMETYSKALNAGQYPLSVLALRDTVAALYVKGIYGNTMTTNPRALDVASALLDSLTPELRKNISERGKEFVTKLKALQREFPDVIEDVKGTGLLVAASIYPEKHKVIGFNCLEDLMRKRGVGVIHGGKNALRFTPHFNMRSEEIDLIVNVLRDLIKAG